MIEDAVPSAVEISAPSVTTRLHLVKKVMRL